MDVLKKHKKPDEDFDPWGKACVDLTERLLIDGPRRAIDDTLRVSNLMMEFLRGFRTFKDLGPCVTFFGSARFCEDHKYYTMAQQMAQKIAKMGFTIMTGGGPGIMEAANRGAKEVGARSVGCNIMLPTEQKPNPYLDQFVEFKHFYVRKVMLLRYSYALVIMPGGFGTMDEVFETLTLIQTKKIPRFPVVVMGGEFWQPLKSMLDMFLTKGTISQDDPNLLFFTDDIEEATSYICEKSQAGLIQALREEVLKTKRPAFIDGKSFIESL